MSTCWLQPDSKESGIWRVDLKTGDRKHLTTTRLVGSLRAAPSGQWLAYTTFVRDAQTREITYLLHVASLPDFEVRTITRRSTDDHLAWSKKEDRLAFVEKDHIAVWTPATNKTARIRVPQKEPKALSWIGSTDSIAYGVENREIWTLDTASGKPERLLTVDEVLESIPEMAARDAAQ